MRLIGTLPTSSEAKRFCDYLVTQRVDCHFEPGSDGTWQIWIEHDDELDRGRAELTQYTANPGDPRYAASAEADRLRKAQVQAAERRRKNFRDVRTTMFASTAHGGSPVTNVLVGICVLVSLMTGFGQDFDKPLLQKLVFQMPTISQPTVGENGDALEPAIIPGHPFDNIKRGEVWRLITPIFLHFGWLHLLCDVMFLWQFGSVIERVKGSGTLILIVLLTALIGNALQGAWMAWRYPNEWALFGGISGVDAGLFGYVWMCGKFRPYERIGVTQYQVGTILGWLVLCSIGFVGPIANGAHWGGLLIGMAIGIAPTLRRRLSI